MRVVSLNSLQSEWHPDLSWLVQVANIEDIKAVRQLMTGGLANLTLLVQNREQIPAGDFRAVLCPHGGVEAGDVIAVTPNRTTLQILYRESDLHHTVFLTNRCNSYCVMCSQPPTRQDDSWLVGEAKQVAQHIRRSPEVLGFTGGEPLLLDIELRNVLETFATLHPNTRFDLLTNGRRLGDSTFAKALLDSWTFPVIWMVPLYGHADFLHDYVVQSPGAFEETLAGLLNLQERRQLIQLRIVLIAPVLEHLPELCAFITKNLPFVREVALMGCEPIGFALANREQCAVNIHIWHKELAAGVRNLTRGIVRPVIMNLPLCSLPSELRPYARRSISDWKQTYLSECAPCTVRTACSGFFAWHERGWLPAEIHPILEEIQ